MHWGDRLNPFNHSTLFPYCVTAIGDTFPISTIGGSLADVLYQPKYAEEVMKLLLLSDHLGIYVWMGGPTVGTMADTTILHQCGPRPEDFIPGEVLLMDGGFPGREHVITPWSKPPKKPMLKAHAQYNDGHSFIRSRGLILMRFRETMFSSPQVSMCLLNYTPGPL